MCGWVPMLIWKGKMWRWFAEWNGFIWGFMTRNNWNQSSYPCFRVLLLLQGVFLNGLFVTQTRTSSADQGLGIVAQYFVVLSSESVFMSDSEAQMHLRDWLPSCRVWVQQLLSLKRSLQSEREDGGEPLVSLHLHFDWASAFIHVFVFKYDTMQCLFWIRGAGDWHHTHPSRILQEVSKTAKRPTQI